MPIQTVAVSNTFNQFRITTNSVIDEVNKLSDGTGNLVINSITANTLITPIPINLNIAGNTGSDVIALASETLSVVGTNGISTTVSGNTVSVNLSSNLTLADLTLSAENANSLVYLNSSKQLRTVPTLSFNGTNVGINNASPGATLDVKGGIRLTGATTGYVGLQVPASGTNTTYTLPASDGLNGQVLQTNGTGTLSWINQTAGGGGANTGSGTSTSRTSFTATGGQTTFSVSYVVGQVDVYMNGSKLIVGNDFTATNGTSIVLAAPAVAGDVVEAVVYSTQWISSGSNLYYANGSVGVGTTNPGARLHVASANTAFAIGTIRIDGANSAGVVNAPVTINAVTDATGNGASQIYFETRADSGSLLERMRIDSTGRVGIGGTPSYRFDVQGGTASFVGSSGVNAIRVAGAGGSWFWLDNPTGGTFRISSGNTAGTNPFTFSDTGNLGIGTASPSSRLDVSGSGTQTVRSVTVDTSGVAVGRFRAVYTGGGGGGASAVDLRAGDGYTYLFTETNSPMLFGTNATERMRIAPTGAFGLSGTNYGTSGQVLTSAGANSTPTWTTPSGTPDFILQAYGVI